MKKGKRKYKPKRTAYVKKKKITIKKPIHDGKLRDWMGHEIDP